MFALGIDPGLTRCGYGAVVQERGGPRLVASGHLATSPADPLGERLAVLLGDLEELFADLQPDVVVVERVLFQVNARTAMSVGQASGLALAVAGRRGCPVEQYSPNEVKQAIAGHGGATKEQMQRMVQVLLGLTTPPRPADRADALALALCHLAGARLRAAAERSESGQYPGPRAAAR
ncbi:MAG: crossover junction endodeoxyribonuclease RuvC [Acidimicrobiaceae bacterium]|nr:crossover junction endodeoxyribonuclease RuvC [Acidimicrobiaceae bacterium]